MVSSAGTIEPYAKPVGSLSTPLLVARVRRRLGRDLDRRDSSSRRSTDSLDRRFGLGEALGGLILLAIAGTLPEIAIVASASLAAISTSRSGT